MESPIDERYRLMLLDLQLEGVEIKNGGSKYVFCCPMCQIGQNNGKYKNRKGCMFWVAKWNAWRFNCMRCLHNATTMYKFLLAVNPSMAREYQRERHHSGTTGKGHDCPRIRGSDGKGL